MRSHQRPATVAVALCCVVLALGREAPAARAFNPIGTVCGIGGLVSGAVGKACSVGGKLLGAGKKVLGASSSSTGGSKAQAVIGLAAIGAWVLVGAKVALDETAKVIAHTTAPHLTTTWFSATYWRMAAIGAILTLPFLFAAAVQSLLRADLALLMRAAFGYLPLALIGVGIAAPVAMLLLAATDEMCAVVSSAAGNAGVHFLSHAGVLAGGLSIIAGSPFLAFLAGLVAAFGALVLWIELLMRDAAVYVVVLMLPIVFAALVWPARRVWAVRAVEVLVALILSKFAIVAVLTLGGAALDTNPFGGISSMLAGGVLVILGAFAPWAMIRLLPLAELAHGAAGTLRGESWRAGRALAIAGGAAEDASGRLIGAGPSLGDAEVVAAAPQDAARAETERLAELPGIPIPAGSDDRDGEAPAPHARPGAAPGDQTDAEAGESPGERLPGLAPQYQMDDFTWQLDLGPDAEWPSSVGSPGGDGGVPPADPGAPSPPADPGPLPDPGAPGPAGPPPSARPPEVARPGDEPDLRPPNQEPEDGHP